MNHKEIIQRTIPISGEKLPAVGIGTWQQFDVGNDSTLREPLMEILKLMATSAIKLIDSSPMYGRSEGVIGDLTSVSNLAGNFFYATKVWIEGEQNGIRQMEDSLQKMKRETMDLMQVHNLVDWQIHLKTLTKWKAEGKIRYTGVTHYVVSAHDELEKIVRSKVVDFVQFNYSIGIRDAEKSLLDACKDNGVAVIINEPFQKNALFHLVKGKALPPWAVDYDIHNWASFFLKYILAHPAVTCVIPGTSDPQHMKDNISACFGNLPDEKGKKKMITFLNQL